MKHHYIPVFYLSLWKGPKLSTGDNGRLCEFRRFGSRIRRRRTSPDGTGYQENLYRVVGAPPELADAVETKFMHMVDTQAATLARRMIEGHSTTWTHEEKKSWVRFLLSLLFRNPEAVALLNGHMLDCWTAANRRHNPIDPHTDRSRAEVNDNEPVVMAMNLLQEIIDNERIGPALLSMEWCCTAMPRSTVPLLTSDRPICMPLGLGDPRAYIMLPVGPRHIFTASRFPGFGAQLAGSDHTSVVKRLNEAVVEQARAYVWGFDDSQLRFVQNRMSRLPDRVLLTEEQRQEALAVVSG